MPPRKKAETAPTPKATAPAVPHIDACTGPRMENYDVLRPDGSMARVARCQECGAQTTK